jgi:hypothetical protein
MGKENNEIEEQTNTKLLSLKPGVDLWFLN